MTFSLSAKIKHVFDKFATEYLFSETLETFWWNPFNHVLNGSKDMAFSKMYNSFGPSRIIRKCNWRKASSIMNTVETIQHHSLLPFSRQWKVFSDVAHRYALPHAQCIDHPTFCLDVSAWARTLNPQALVVCPVNYAAHVMRMPTNFDKLIC